MSNINKNHSAFTIVELLVVIVVIGILAAITIVSYTGISQKATASSLQSDLSNASKKLKLYQVEYGKYPQQMTSTDGNVTYCPSGDTTTEDTKYCIKPSSGNLFSYPSTVSSSKFILEATDASNTKPYRITESSSIVALVLSVPTVTLGSQTWTKYNLNVGSKIANSLNQSNNSTVEKWCYSNLDINCDTYGGLYQWNEMMQYSTIEKAQGICPNGFHLPSNEEYKKLEMYLGMTQQEADVTGFRGTDQGAQMKSGGSTGWDGLIGGTGYRNYFGSLGSLGYFWTSTQIDATNARGRMLSSSNDQVSHSIDTKAVCTSVRCIMN